MPSVAVTVAYVPIHVSVGRKPRTSTPAIGVPLPSTTVPVSTAPGASRMLASVTGSVRLNRTTAAPARVGAPSPPGPLYHVVTMSDPAGGMNTT